MAVRRTAPVDERALLARYPFLPGAEALVDELAPSLTDLLSDPTYANAREMGRRRVQAAVEDPTGGGPADESMAATPEERFLSFLYARLLVSAARTPAPVRRWAVAEAKRGWGRLEKAPTPELDDVARRLGYQFRGTGEEVALSLTDYLHLATGIREGDFRLVRQGVRGGEVHVRRARAARLLQEGIRMRLTAPIPLAAEVREVLTTSEAAFLDELIQRIPMPVARSVGASGPIRRDVFPPCIRKMARMLEAGENLSHSGRFALAAFLHRVGADTETIVDAYRGAPDFDESVTRYQVEHITTHDGGRGYTPPECATLRAHGLCFRDGDPGAPQPIDRERDPRCFDETLRRPIQYYIRRGGAIMDRGPPEEPAPSGAKAPGMPSGPGTSP
jgi:DNA primase large subunit